MHSRAARLVLLFLFLIAISTASYLFWKGESLATAQAADARAFDDSARAIERSLLEIRAAQRGYVAAGQGGEFWAARVAQVVQDVRKETSDLRAIATAPQAQTGLDEVRSSIDDFVKVDRRAVEYMKRDQKPLASDVIFADGVELTDAGLAALERARGAERSARAEAVELNGRRSLFAIAAGAGSAVLVVLLLVPSPAPRTVVAMAESGAPAAPIMPSIRSLETSRPAATSAATPADAELWTPERAVFGDTASGPAALAAEEAVPVNAEPATPMALAEPMAAEASVSEQVAPAGLTPSSTDFAGVASLCIDLARVVDTRALPSLLDRAASLLDASGIILWIADPDGRELNPIFAQGYPQQLVNRLGTIPREAENATAAAFRTSLLQTVMADDISAGAIAAPLVTSGGCVGVMAAEVRHDGERQDLKLAAASIVAAQLATLVGPPAARSQSRTGAAG
jgi:CHASE3 domain sensor protein